MLGAIVKAIYVPSFWVSGNQANLAPGWSSLIFVLLFVGGTILVSLGLIGIYIGHIFREVKRRPSYLIRRKQNNQKIRNYFTNPHLSINIQVQVPVIKSFHWRKSAL